MGVCERCSHITRTLTVVLVEVIEICSETAVQAEVRTCLGLDPKILSSHNSRRRTNMGALTDLPSPEEIQERIKERYDSLFYVNDYGERQAYVCVICDKFIINKDDLKSLSVPKVIFAKDVLKWSSQEDDRRTHELQDHYQAIFEARLNHPSLEGLALSPRAPIYKSKGIDCFSCCGRCYHNIQKPKVPRHAIINSNCVGAAPKCLLDLTEPELAFLTPVKHYGYCFTFTGGKQKCLKGTLSYVRVS